MATIGEQVTSKRKELKLTQMQLATKAGISLDTLSRIENNRSVNPTLVVINLLQKALGIKFEI